MKKISCIIALIAIVFTQASAQENRGGTAEENALHAKNVTGIMGKWKVIETAVKVVEPELIPKKEQFEKIYKETFGETTWEFLKTGTLNISKTVNGKLETSKESFTVTAQFISIYLKSTQNKGLMKIEDDGKLTIQLFITAKSFLGIQFEKIK
jgi:hypothetical protein